MKTLSQILLICLFIFTSNSGLRAQNKSELSKNILPLFSLTTNFEANTNLLNNSEKVLLTMPSSGRNKTAGWIVFGVGVGVLTYSIIDFASNSEDGNWRWSAPLGTLIMYVANESWRLFRI